MLLNRKCLFLLVLYYCLFNQIYAQWKPISGKILTQWASKVNADSVLPEYPRPQLTRENNWKNLNGLWQYAILPFSESETLPSSYQGNILVPFAVESALSGVSKNVGKENVLWYHRTLEIENAMKKGRLLLHFGAIDWHAKIFLNGVKVGEHKGGYNSFSIDITKALKKGIKQELNVEVWDPTNDGTQPVGKQTIHPEGIWYTSVTGIWRTVWLENVPETYIVSTRQVPNIDKNNVHISFEVDNQQSQDEFLMSVFEKGKLILTKTTKNRDAVLNIAQPKLWSPEDPFLYDLKIAIIRKGKTIDKIETYFGMRKISLIKDNNGIQRLALNNKFQFQYGPLDQGWWPDGLYTAPTDDALKFDIEQTKSLGFNMIRKHIKVEPDRWYYYCDKLGMLVWQDMPSGDIENVWDQFPGFISGRPLDKVRSEESQTSYKMEWRSIMDQLYNYPCIVVWVPFNEAWGQFKTREIVEWTMAYDSSRLVNPASGGNFVQGSPGNIVDLHHYPDAYMPDPSIYGKSHALVLGEFGGLGLPLEGHTWLSNGNWGYQSFKNGAELFGKYKELLSRFPKLIELGLSAAVYTQTTDVEMETNGLFTYDRKILKFPSDSLYQLHTDIIHKTIGL